VTQYPSARKDVGADRLGERSGPRAGEPEGGDIGRVFGLLFWSQVAVLVHCQGADYEST
jgi:hypothetical protein